MPSLSESLEGSFSSVILLVRTFIFFAATALTVAAFIFPHRRNHFNFIVLCLLPFLIHQAKPPVRALSELRPLRMSPLCVAPTRTSVIPWRILFLVGLSVRIFRACPVRSLFRRWISQVSLSAVLQCVLDPRTVHSVCVPRRQRGKRELSTCKELTFVLPAEETPTRFAAAAEVVPDTNFSRLAVQWGLKHRKWK